VTFSDGSVRKASVLGVDRPSDIALLQIHKDDSLPFPCVSFGDSEKVRTGDFVIALGAPGMLRNSVSLGIVSATRQSSELGLPGQATSYIQTDAAINVGNSGGPLINADGQVIGINTMKAAELQGISFAIPINLAREIVNELLKHGRVRRPFIGLSVLPLRRDMVRFQKAEDPNFPDVDHGLLVVEVIPGSPADRAGLRPGDCILAIDGRDISSKADLHNIIGFDVER
jgi:HtrA serine peptidase 2